MQDAADLIDALSGFAWPILIVLILFLFREQIRGFIRGADEATVKAGGFEASVKRTAGAVASLAQAEATRGGGEDQDQEAEAQRAANAVTQAVTRLPDQHGEPRILWVDDLPDNNRLERQTFEELGISIELARSTDVGLDLLESEHFDLVITDMGRQEGPRAGYDLLKGIRERFGSSPPVIIYSIGGSTGEHQAEAREHGAYASTDSPTQLLRYVTAALEAQHEKQQRKPESHRPWALFKR